MKDARITVVFKQPGVKAKLQVIDNTLEAFQTLVDGYIETACRLSPDLFVICNEEGKLRHMEPNLYFLRNGWVIDEIVGPVVISKLGEDGDFVDMDPEECQRAEHWLEDHQL